MFNNENGGYSLADIAAATGNGNNGDWGNGGGWWIILLFLAIFAGWGNGNGGLFSGQGSTGSGITDGYILTSDFANIERKIDGVNNGLCDGFYAMNTGMLNGFAGVNTSITSLGTQLQQCCCDNKYQSATQAAELNYRLAEQSCQTRQGVADAAQAITLNADANTRSILAALQDMQNQAMQEKIATLTADNQALKFAASQQAQNAYLINALQPAPIPAYQVPNPYAAYGHIGCGCNCA